MATPDYSKIWGANSPLAKYEFTEADYLRGWEFIGSMPPARTMFDAWMRKADEKMRWLYDNAFSENSLGGFLFWRLPDTAYFVGEKRALQDGPLDVYIECTIAGRTSKEQMKKLPQGAEIGKTFVDGTATWLVRQFATSAALDDHRTKTPLDHPDGSVLKRHLGFEVYDKGETDARLNVKANANHGYHVPAPEAANNTRFLRNDNTWQAVTAGNIGAYTKGETYTKGEIDSRVNGKVSKSGDTMSGRLTLPSILANDWFRALGDCGFYFENHGGGWHMTDNDWIRAYNGKNVYTSGKMRCDGGFEGNLRGTANNANVAQHVNNESQNMRFHWSGQSGQPTWLWGGNDPHNMYVWNPANFNVNHAKTADNATRATNADKLQGKDVNHFYRHLGGRETPTLVALVDWERMKKENGGQDVRNIRNPATGIVAYGGGTTFGGKYANGTIFLKQSYRNFDKVLVFIVDITGRDTTLNLLDSWLLFFLFANSFTLDLVQDATLIWNVYGNKRGSSSEALSTETLWRGFYQNCGLIEIYGMNY
jgi:Bacterial shufflon protein, N-terminal constant region.